MFSKTEIETLKEILKETEVSYESEPIGDGNPYYRCPFCKVSDPEISYRGHNTECTITRNIERREILKSIISKLEDICLKK